MAQLQSLIPLAMEVRKNCSAIYLDILHEFWTLTASLNQNPCHLPVNERLENLEHNRRIQQVFECSPFQTLEVPNLPCKTPLPSCSLHCFDLNWELKEKKDTKISLSRLLQRNDYYVAHDLLTKSIRMIFSQREKCALSAIDCV